MMKMYSYTPEMFNTTTKTLDELNAEEAQIYLPAAIFVSVLCIIGVISNIHILAVFWLRMERSKTRIFILSLAVLDLLTSVFGMPFIAATAMMPYKFTDAAACKCLTMVSYFSTSASGLVLVMIAVDRYRQVCRPMGRQMSRKFVTLSCVLSIVIALLLTWPTLIFYNVNDVDTGYHSIIGRECAFDHELRDSSYVRMFNYVLLGVSLLSFVILVVLYTCIHRTIKKHEAYLATFIIQKPHKTNMRKGFSPSIDTLNESLFDTICSQDDTILSRSDRHNRTSDDVRDVEKPVEQSPDELPLRQMSTINEEQTDDTSEHKEEPKEVAGIANPLEQKHAENEVGMTSQNNSTNQNGNTKHVQLDIVQTKSTPRERNSFESSLTVDTQRGGRTYRSSSSVRAFFRQKKSTGMFIMITVVFLCGYVFHEILILTITLSPDTYARMDRTEKSLYYTALWFVFINNVCNSAIYGYFHKTFRDELKQFYRGLVCRK